MWNFYQIQTGITLGGSACIQRLRDEESAKKQEPRKGALG
jgi:hypothetical protein